MAVLDLSRATAPITPDRPCGDDLEYDGDFLAMLQAAQGKPERQMGSEVVPAEEPDWKEVKRLALGLCARTKDVRTAVMLCRALTAQDGLAGLDAGLRFLHALVTEHWAGLYPLLDADDGNDPTMRVNALVALTDPTGFLRTLRETPIVAGRAAGRFSFHDVDVAAGNAPSLPGRTPATPELIRAAFREAGQPSVAATVEVARAAEQALQSLGTALDERLGTRSPNLRPLASILQGIREATEKHLEPGMNGNGSADHSGDGAQDAERPAGGGGSGGGVRSRDDVVVWLDRICDFYARQEPSSPVPVLLRRARALVNKNFLDVIRDLVPDALPQAEHYRAREESS